jgi:hypothetical protein
MRAMGVAAAVVIVPVSLLTGCSSSGVAGSTAASAPPAESPSTASSGTAGSSSASSPANQSSGVVLSSTRPAATIDTNDSAGDKATVTVKVGKLSLVSDVANSIIQACNGVYDGMGTSTEQSVAIPVQLSATVTSSEPVSMIIVLDGSNAVEPSSQAPSPGTVGPANFPPIWAQGFADSAQCTYGGNSDQSDAEFDWDNAAPGQTNTWNGYLIVPSAVTPDDPTGIDEDAGLELIVPQFTLGDNTADYTVDSGASHNIVNCVDGIGDAVSMVSVDPKAALAEGCTK